MNDDLTTRRAQLADALNPANIKIDARDARDRLAFVAKFAQLILYYDQTNQRAGNWQAFFLKDPTVLLAAISETNYAKYLAAFQELSAPQPTESLRIECINQLGQLLHDMFAQLNLWLRFMNLGADDGFLSQFLQKKIVAVLAEQLHNLMATQQALHVSDADFLAVRSQRYLQFEPLWQVRSRSAAASNLYQTQWQDASAEVRHSRALEALKEIFSKVFAEFVQLVDGAKTLFYQQKTWTTQFPDIGLLMSFIGLLQNQQEMVNAYAQQHLDFYYRDVLRLVPREAQVDTVFVCLTLADHAKTMSLPAGTAFLAGKYSDQTDVIFNSVSAAEINAAKIQQSYSLYFCQAPDAGMYWSKNVAPSSIVKNQLQEVQTWDAFGNSQGQKVQQGFAIACPMLFLQGGTRTVTVTLTFGSSAGLSLNYAAYFLGASYFFSTQKTWFSPNIATASCLGNVVSIVLNLNDSDPAISAFSDNPDGYSCQWPLLKILLADQVDLIHPPQLLEIDISLDVKNLSQLSLANDLSPLPNKGSVQTFGPLPEMGNCFYVGSNELFSKPLTTVDIQIQWENLPADLSQYYAAYNQYLLREADASTIVVKPEFCNSAFIGEWRLLNEKFLSTSSSPWTSGSQTLFQEQRTTTKANPDNQSAATVAGDNTHDALPVAASNVLADATDNIKVANTTATNTSLRDWSNNASATIFNLSLASYAPYQAHPTLCLTPLLPPQQINSGYFYFELQNPKDGFGANLYPKIVSDVVLRNALTLMQKAAPADDSIMTKIMAGLQAAWQTISGAMSQLLQNLTARVQKIGRMILDFFKSLIYSIAKPVSKFVQGIGQKLKTWWSSLSTGMQGILRALASTLSTKFPQWAGLQTFVMTLESKAENIQSGLEEKLTQWTSDIQAEAKTAEDKIQESVAAPLKSPIVATDSDGLLAMPNVPFSPKQTAVLLNYRSTFAATFSATLKTGTTSQLRQKPYPLSLYHYGAFQPYLVYDSDASSTNLGFLQLQPKASDSANTMSVVSASAPPTLPLFTGLASAGCMYLEIVELQAPCTLSLFAEVCGALDQVDSTDSVTPSDQKSLPRVSYFYWGEQGWTSLTVLQDSTNELRCSGIIQLAIPAISTLLQQQYQQSYLRCPLMPTSNFWIAVSAPQSSTQTSMSFLGTQAVMLQREPSASMPNDTPPRIVENTIVATKTKIAQISTVLQPFSSFGGLPAENSATYEGNSSFYRRVSQRLSDKDRATTPQNMLDLAYEASTDLFYVRQTQCSMSRIAFGVVRRYANSLQPGAFRPVLGTENLAAIRTHLQRRAPSFLTLRLDNLPQQQVKVSAQLLIENASQECAIADQINQQLRQYFSPWIETNNKQMEIDQGINRAALVDFLSAQKGVLAVNSLSILLEEVATGSNRSTSGVSNWTRCIGDPVIPTLSDAIFVSADQHTITFSYATSNVNAVNSSSSLLKSISNVELSHV